MKSPNSKAGKLPSSPSLTTLLSSYFQGQQNLMPVLKCLYILIRKSLSSRVNEGFFESDTVGFTLKSKLEDTTKLCSLLFKELQRKLLFDSNGAVLDRFHGPCFSNTDVGNSAEEVLFLLRCCVLMVKLHPHDQILDEKIWGVVMLVRRLSCKVIDSQRIYGYFTASFADKFIPKSPDSSVRFRQQILEVYLDELFSDRALHAYPAISNLASSTLQNQSRGSSPQVDIVLEVIAAHFLLSVSGDHSIESFIESLVWTKKPVISSPELCLTVGLYLINHPVVMSSPVLLRSHLISLVSDVIGIHFLPEKTDLNIRSSLHLSAFYDSVILYVGHMSKLFPASCFQLYKLETIVHRSFETHFNSEIYEKVNSVCIKLNALQKTHIFDIRNKVMSSVVTDAISYVEANAYIVDESSRHHVTTLLSSLISFATSDGVNESLMQGIREMTLSDCCLLASIMKLMSCSLLQANNCLQNKLSCSKTFTEWKDALSESSSLSGIMSCFAEFNFLPVKAQQFIADSLKPIPSTYDKHKSMFVHFASVLSFCMFGGLDMVVRGCLFLMLVLMNILYQKEGCTDSLRSSIALGAESPSHELTPANCTSDFTSIIHSDSVSKISKGKFCSKVASNFERIRQSLLRHQAAHVSAERICDGEAYLKLVTNNAKDIADLKDFIVCDEGKSYKTYIKAKRKYSFKKFQKLQKRQQQQKFKLCNLIESLKRM